jgi:hypothetical protein
MSLNTCPTTNGPTTTPAARPVRVNPRPPSTEVMSAPLGEVMALGDNWPVLGFRVVRNTRRATSKDGDDAGTGS